MNRLRKQLADFTKDHFNVAPQPLLVVVKIRGVAPPGVALAPYQQAALISFRQEVFQVAALGEMLGLLEKSDVEVGKSSEFLQEMPIMSPALKRVGGLVAGQNLSPHFPISLVAKEFG